MDGPFDEVLTTRDLVIWTLLAVSLCLQLLLLLRSLKAHGMRTKGKVKGHYCAETSALFWIDHAIKKQLASLKLWKTTLYSCLNYLSKIEFLQIMAKGLRSWRFSGSCTESSFWLKFLPKVMVSWVSGENTGFTAWFWRWDLKGKHHFWLLKSTGFPLNHWGVTLMVVEHQDPRENRRPLRVGRSRLQRPDLSILI